MTMIAMRLDYYQKMVSTEGDNVESVVASVDCVEKAAKRHFLIVLIIIFFFIIVVIIIIINVVVNVIIIVITITTLQKCVWEVHCHTFPLLGTDPPLAPDDNHCEFMTKTMMMKIKMMTRWSPAQASCKRIWGLAVPLLAS